MGIILQQSVKGTLVSYVGVALGAVNTLFLFPRFLEADQFGLTRVLLSGSMLISQFAEFGGSNAINRYFPQFHGEKQTLKRFVFWILVKALAVYSIIALAIFFLREPILEKYEDKPLVLQFYGYIFPLALLLLLYNLLEAYARSMLKIAVSALLREVYPRVVVMAAILLFHFGIIDFSLFVFLFAAAYGSIMLIMLAYVFWLDRHFMAASLSFARHELVKEVFVYGFFSILTTAVWRAVSQLDILMLSYLHTLSGVAVYTIAFYIMTLMQYPQRLLQQISIPIITRAILEEKWDLMRQLYQKVALNQFVAGLMIFLIIWVNLDSISTLLPESYRHIAGVILVLGAGRLIDMSTGVNGEIIAYSKHFRFNLWAGLILVVSCVLTNYLLIPVYGILGAAIGTSLSLLIFNIVKTLFVYVKFDSLPFGKNMPLALLVAAVIFSLSYLLPSFGNLCFNIILRTAFVLLLFLPPVLLLGLSDDLSGLFFKIISRLRSL